MNTDHDKFLTEKVLGECWHEYQPEDRGNAFAQCTKCKRPFFLNEQVDFSTGNGFIKLFTACQEKEWWREFINWLHCKVNHNSNQEHLWLKYFIHPVRFKDAVYEFLKEKEK